MNRQLAYAVVADGETDRLLVPVIQWAVHRLDPGVEILEPEFRKRRGSVAEYISDYSPLENLPAFRRFQDELAERYPYRNLLDA